MAAPTPAEAAADSRCFTCLSDKQLTAMSVYLLGQILLESNPMADVSPAAIAEASRCFLCLSGKQLIASNVYLLTQIFNNGGTGGGGCCDYWEDTGPAPSGPPADQTKVQTVHFRDGFPSLTWDPADLAWH